MLNDEGLQDVNILCIVEPYVYLDVETGTPTCGAHRKWRSLLPTCQRLDGGTRHKFRAAIWVNNDTKAEQIHISDHDMVAVVVKVGSRRILVVAVYDPGTNDKGRAAKEEELERKLDLINEAIRIGKGKDETDTLEVVITSDFNRHHEWWGGHHDSLKPKDGDQIVAFAQENGLSSLLRPGTVTWQHQTARMSSCVDVILASDGLVECLVKCTTTDTDHGSDHWAVMTAFQWQGGREEQIRPSKEQRLLLEKADWPRINEALRKALPPVPENRITKTEFEDAAKDFHKIVETTIKKLVPRARPSPFAKRWWTTELTILRQALTSARNRVVRLRRRDQDTIAAQQDWKRARGLYFQEMEKQKRSHWHEFLSDPANIWKANQYTRNASSSHSIPILVTQGRVAKEDKEKASMLLDSFFPIPAEPVPAGEEMSPKMWDPKREYDIPKKLPPITIKEVEEAIMGSHPNKAAGPDQLTFKVWQNILSSTRLWIQWLYQQSVELSVVPEHWKVAKIVTIRKPGKTDYTLPKAFRPISLLCTLSKGLERLMARRLSYMAEKYDLLPSGHFGGRPGRSCEMALNLLVEKISDCWRRGRTLSLATFDVQGAFNGVHPKVLGDRLRDRRIPEWTVRWVEDFLIGRKARLLVGDYLSPEQDIRHAGIPQGSPLSPLLYIFYNADLIDMPVGQRMGTCGYIDDFTVWADAETAHEACQMIQERALPKAKTWAEEGGAIFEANKTGLIHFTSPRSGKPRETNTATLTFLGQVIEPQESIKLLGFYFTSDLKMKKHVEERIIKAQKACFAIARLKGLRPAQMRHLYQAVVAPILDYGSSVWYATEKRATTGLVDRMARVQALGARMITGAFRTVAKQVACDEAGLIPLQTSLGQKAANLALAAQVAPESNPAYEILKRFHWKSKAYQTAWAATWQRHRNRLARNNQGASAITTRQTFHPAPWKQLADVYIETDPDKAIQAIPGMGQSMAVIYTDGSRRGKLCSAAAVITAVYSRRVTIQKTVGWSATCSVLSAELKAIQLAIQHAVEQRTPKQAIWIMTDSQQALRAVQDQRLKSSCVEVLQMLFTALEQAYEKGINIFMRWVPAHKGNEGNDLADKAAKAMTEQGLRPDKDPKVYVRETRAVGRLIREDIKKEPVRRSAACGVYTYKLDKALPGRHTRMLYDNLTRKEAALLIQARTGHNFLNLYVSRVNPQVERQCRCGAEAETVKHILLACPQWEQLRKEMRATAGPRWGDLSYMLGGWSDRCDRRTGRLVDGPKDKWKPDMKAVKASIHFLEQTGRMQSGGYKDTQTLTQSTV